MITHNMYKGNANIKMIKLKYDNIQAFKNDNIYTMKNDNILYTQKW